MRRDDAIRQSVLLYARAAFPSIIVSDHHIRIAQRLQNIDREGGKRIVITAPPRHSKSMLCAEFFPAWALGRNSARQIIYATYGGDLSTTFGRRVKAQLGSDLFRKIFPACQIAQDSHSSSHIETLQRGVYTATSVGGAMVGKGADIFIMDDPFKSREEAESKNHRDKVWEWWESGVESRLQPGGSMLVIATRWHEDDLTGRLLARAGDSWEHLYLPAIGDDGEPLWPSFWPLEAMLAIKGRISSYEWESLYQGRPSSRAGHVLQVEHLKRYHHLPATGRIGRVQTVDAAIKTSEKNDYSVIETWDKYPDGYYLVDCWRSRVEYPALKAALVSQFNLHRPSKIIVEDAAAGQQVIQEFRNLSLPIKPFRPISDKLTRALPLADAIECGKVFLPERASYMNDLVAEWRSFPSGQHDDTVDAASMAYEELRVDRSQTIRNPMAF